MVFGELNDNVIPASGTLEWSGENLKNIECVSEFVVMYREDKAGTEREREVLCPGYRVTSVMQVFSCQYNLTSACGSRVEILLEAWTEGRMVQPQAKVLVNCYEESEQESEMEEMKKDGSGEREEENMVEGEDEDVMESSGSQEENWAFPLVLASLQAFSKATRGNSTGKGCQWAEWSAWTPSAGWSASTPTKKMGNGSV